MRTLLDKFYFTQQSLHLFNNNYNDMLNRIWQSSQSDETASDSDHLQSLGNFCEVRWIDWKTFWSLIMGKVAMAITSQGNP